MNLPSYLHFVPKFEQIKFDLEQEVGRALDSVKVAEYLTAKGLQPDSVEEVVLHLDLEFLSQFPVFVERIVLDSTVIPPELPVSIEKRNYKVRGEVWTIHQNDVDQFPSSPHAHNYDQNLVMHLGNGRLYRKRHYVATAKRRDFLRLRDLIKNVGLPPLENEG